jgi:hypothetical protein
MLIFLILPLSPSFPHTTAAQSWGVLLYENLHVLNILTKGSLRDTLANREWRLVLALMVRETYKVTLGGVRGVRDLP